MYVGYTGMMQEMVQWNVAYTAPGLVKDSHGFPALGQVTNTCRTHHLPGT